MMRPLAHPITKAKKKPSTRTLGGMALLARRRQGKMPEHTEGNNVQEHSTGKGSNSHAREQRA